MAILTTSQEHLLPESDAARYLSLSKAWLRKRRLIGRGPAYVRLGRRIAYRRDDLDALIASGRVDPERIK
ncbi:MAG: helix-turn-helix domain-containing protein [Acidobacteria bacterium]|nr:helix-turn-helix domain-containing protein [Acidobacteriota bacterium]